MKLYQWIIVIIGFVLVLWICMDREPKEVDKARGEVYEADYSNDFSDSILTPKR